MKRPILISLLFSAGFPAAMLISGPAMAQVTSNDDALPAAAPASPPAPHKVTQQPAQGGGGKPASRKPQTSAHGETGATTTAIARAPAAQRVGAPPDVPAQPPRPVVIPPPAVVVPTHPSVPPEEVKPDPAAKGKTEKLGNGVRVLFDANSSGMSQAMIDAVREEARHLATRPTLRVTLWASASGTTEDLSTPRRIALARALAVRSILIREGVATTRIYPRATGLAQPGTAPADRLDIIAEGAVPAPISEAQFGTASRTPTP